MHKLTREAHFDIFMEPGSGSEILHLKNIYWLATLETPLCDWFLRLRFISSLSEHILDIWTGAVIGLEDPEASRGWVTRECFGGFAWFLRTPMQPMHIVMLFVGEEICRKK